jgi:hypothetical protein
MKLPLILNTHQRCLDYLDREELGKLCLTAKLWDMEIDVASLDPALSFSLPDFVKAVEAQQRWRVLTRKLLFSPP